MSDERDARDRLRPPPPDDGFFSAQIDTFEKSDTSLSRHLSILAGAATGLCLMLCALAGVAIAVLLR